jgi:hypothetical protein
MSEPDDGFLSRWARRKAHAREGAVPEDVPTTPVAPAAPPLPAAATPSAVASESAMPAPAPPPTLDDVAALTRESHFGRFLHADVDPAVKNAALKKLFADPHFNVMDGLDTYIDDYGLPDPLPAGMLRKMAQAQFLGLFADEAAPPAPADSAALPPAASNPEAAIAQALPNEDTDLRLQPNDAARCPGAEPGPGPDGGCER